MLKINSKTCHWHKDKITGYYCYWEGWALA